MTHRRRTLTGCSALGVLLLFISLVQIPRPAAQEDCYSRVPATPITVNFRDADVPSILRFLQDEFGVNMVVTPDVYTADKVTLQLRDVPARDVLRVVIESNQLQCVLVASTLRIGTIPKVSAEQQRVQAEQQRMQAEQLRQETEKLRIGREQREIAELQARGPIREETIRLSYAKAEDVAAVLQGMLGLLPTAIPTPPPQIYQPPPPVNIPSGMQVPSAGPTTATPEGPPPGGIAPPDVFSKGLTIRAYKPTNAIFIRYYANDIERIRRLIKEQLDIPLPQVSIASQMVITTQNALEQIGIQWGGTLVDQRRNLRSPTLLGAGNATPNPGGGIGLGVNEFTPQNPGLTLGQVLPVSATTGLPLGGNVVNLPTSSLPTAAAPAAGVLFGIVGSQFNLNLAIQALETQGKARSLAEPRVVTVENSTAIISRGFEVPFASQSGLGGTQVQFKDALLSLQVTPSVVRENGITGIRMKVVIENNEPDFTRAIAGNPPIFKRRAETDVLVKEGERLVIGGVMVETDNKSVRQVPLLGSIPIVGWLFKAREDSVDRQELIVIITPTVVPALTSRR